MRTLGDMRRLGLVAAVILCASPLIADAALLRNLKMGDQGSDVRELQQLLNRDQVTRLAAAGPGSPGNETTYFGRLTQDAIMRLQQKYAAFILAPIGLSSPTGYVGNQTRLVLARLSQGVNPPAPHAINPPPPAITSKTPHIDSISPPVVVSINQELTIQGTNFTNAGNTVIISSEKPNSFVNLLSPDGTTLHVSFHFSTADVLKQQLALFKTKGNYAAVASALAANIKERIPGVPDAEIPVLVVVKNANGQSSSAKLLINMTSILNEIGQAP